jgi:hypothetical protein
MLNRCKRILSFAFLLGFAVRPALASDEPPSIANDSGSAWPAPAFASTWLGADSSAAPDATRAPEATPGDCCIEPGCCPSCCCCCQPGFDGGATLHYLRPVIKNNTAFLISTFGNGAPVVLFNQNFDFDFRASPSAWLGWQGPCGFGVRATWFHLDDPANGINEIAGANQSIVSPSGFIFSPPTCQLTASDGLQIDSWDLDFTKCCCVGKTCLTVGAGLRWMHIDQNYFATNAFPNRARTGYTIYQAENDDNNFHGIGPTFLLEARRPLGCSHFSLYFDGRAGCVIGDRSTSSVQSFTLVGTTFNNNTGATRTIGLTELELGLEWARQCGRFKPFFRAGAEARGYYGTGTAETGAFTAPAPEAPLGLSGDIGLFGAALSVGVRF